MRALFFGTGSAASRYANLLLDEDPHCLIDCVTNFAGPVPDFFKNSYKFGSTEFYKNNYDFAVVANVASKHLRSLEHCFHLDLPTLVEKPLFENSSEISLTSTDFLKWAKKNVTVGYNLRFTRGLQRLKEELPSIDPWNLISLDFSAGSHLSHWRKGRELKQSASGSKANGGGVLRELSHEIDSLNWLFPNYFPMFLYSYGFNSGSLDIDEQISDLYFCHGVFGSDTYQLRNEFKISLNFCCPSQYRRYSIITRDIFLEWDGISNMVTRKEIDRDNSSILIKRENDLNSSYSRLLKNFLLCLRYRDERNPYLCSFGQGLKVVKQIDLIESLNGFHA